MGTAGSGKTALVHALSAYLEEKNEDFAILNLDPGIRDNALPYTPDIDIRDYVSVEKVMSTYDLGPNGALIASMDLIINYVQKLREDIDSISPDILLVDTPGQMEIFAHRHTGKIVIDNLLSYPDNRLSIVFIFDPFLCYASPGSFLSMLLLAESVYWRFEAPVLHVLSKIDMFDPEFVEQIIDLARNPSKILVKEDLLMQRAEKSPLLAAILENDEILRRELIPISSLTGEGIFDLYSNLLNVWSETA